MIKSDAWEAIVQWLKEAAPFDLDWSTFIAAKNTKLSDLASVLAARFPSTKEVDAYMSFVLDDMSRINQWKGRGGPQVRFHQILNWACKEERLANFILDIGMSARQKPASSIAGFHPSGSEDDDMSQISIELKGKEYWFLYARNGDMFFYSHEAGKVAVQYPSGKVVSYKLYKKKFGEKRVKLLEIFKAVYEIDSECRSDAMACFLIKIRQARARSRRKNFYANKGKAEANP